MSAGKSVAANAAWLLVATTAQKALSFVSFTIVANIVGPSTTGLFHFAVSITSIFVTFSDLGLTPVLIREMAGDEERGRAFLARAIRLKLLLIPLAVLGVLGYAALTDITGVTFMAVLVACFVMSCDAVSVLWYGAIRGRRVLKHEAVGILAGQICTAIVSIAAAILGWGAVGLVFGLLAGSIWNVIWSLRQARALGLTSRMTTEWPLKRIVQLATPFALAGIFVKIYSYVDTLLLKQFHPDEVVGHYAVAYKVTYALQFLPLAFVAALYPSLSAAHSSGKKEEIEQLLTGSLRLMMLAGVPLAALLSALAEPIITAAYPKFVGSIVPLSILPWVLIPIFLDFPVGSLLNATNRAHLKTTAMGVAMIVNVIANFLLVPTYGAMGAAWSGVVSFWLLLFVGLIFVRNDVPWKWMTFLSLRGAGAAIAIWYPTLVLARETPWYVACFSGALLALFVVFLFGLVAPEDMKRVYGWLRRKPEPTINGQ